MAVTLFIIIPLAMAFVVYVTGVFVKRVLPDVLACASCFALTVLSFLGLFRLQAAGFQPWVYKVGGWAPPIGISLVLDGFSAVVLIVVNVVALAAVVFSVGYMEKYTDKTKYYTLFLLMLSGMNGLTITGDMFNLFVFLEIATISSAALVAFGTEQDELEASFRYLVLGSVASLFLLLGIAVLYGFTSSLNMADIARILVSKKSAAVTRVVTALFIMGFGLKSALVPFHAWLPDAHPSAPAPISAMLSGILIKSVGVYALVRVLMNVIGAPS
jgi:multicomponent Na+:H+ antiporter subunit D